MNYEQTLDYLFTSTPVFQHSGAPAYKPGLDVSLAFDNYLDNPHRSYRTVHVGGTNGKGSVCHTLAAILQEAGYRVGLFTSPHLRDFRERIRVNGKMIGKNYVTDFVARHLSFFEPLKPSFFELTSAMALAYFRFKKVDIAVIEVGLGGRLDSTNIITPVLSVITNISMDHTDLLGETLGEIAYEKAGIIKDGVPVVIGETDSATVENVFREKAGKMHAPLFFAQKEKILKQPPVRTCSGEWTFDTEDFGTLCYELTGQAQKRNMQTVLCALRELNKLLPDKLSQDAVESGVYNVGFLTGLRGRWEKLLDAPYVVADTGHNPGAWKYLTPRIEALMKENHCEVYMIIGFSKDKDIDTILSLMPKDAFYVFTNANTRRALPVETLLKKARAAGLKGQGFVSIYDAVTFTMINAKDDDIVFIGGSNFVVADILPLFDYTKKKIKQMTEIITRK
jgi:dihydrofolate synthase/folylpolyglutamate synthase